MQNDPFFDALDAGAEVAAVAEALEAHVVSYRRGRGVIPTSHRPAPRHA
ncbi:MAG: hypothetical protein ACREFN_04270 [Acetobacteraceae bacterium]